MFPDPYDLPPLRLESSIRVDVPFAIRFQFLSPPLGIILRDRAMDGATMPETAIDENSDLVSRQGDINRSTGSRDRHMQSKASAHPPDLASQSYFRRGIEPRLCRQPFGGGWIRPLEGSSVSHVPLHLPRQSSRNCTFRVGQLTVTATGVLLAEFGSPCPARRELPWGRRSDRAPAPS